MRTDTSSPSSAEAASSPVERAFRLLRYIAEGGSTANLSDVARQIGVNRVTVMRLIESLKAAELIQERPAGGSHRLGLPFLTLAASALGASDLTARARQILPGLVEQTGLSAFLAVLEGAEIVYLICETPDTPLVTRIRVGSRLPAHRATPGLAMLASADGEALRALRESAGESTRRPIGTRLSARSIPCARKAVRGVFPGWRRVSIPARSPCATRAATCSRR